MIVVISSFGEYEQKNQQLHGVFENLADAEAAVHAATKQSPARRKLYDEWEARRTAFLATLTPLETYKSGLRPDDIYHIYKEHEYEAAKNAAGKEPEFFLADVVCFYEVKPGQMYQSGADPIKEIELKEGSEQSTLPDPNPPT